MRKMVPLYLHGFGSAIELRQRLLMADSLAAWDTAIATGASVLMLVLVQARLQACEIWWLTRR